MFKFQWKNQFLILCIVRFSFLIFRWIWVLSCLYVRSLLGSACFMFNVPVSESLGAWVDFPPVCRLSRRSRFGFRVWFCRRCSSWCRTSSAYCVQLRTVTVGPWFLFSPSANVARLSLFSDLIFLVSSCSVFHPSRFARCLSSVVRPSCLHSAAE
jgi:hypothetical protein